MDFTLRATTTVTTVFLLLLTTPFTTAAPTAIITTDSEPTCTSIPPFSSTPSSRLNLVNLPDLHLPPQTQTLTFVLPSAHWQQEAPGGPCTLRARFPPHWEVFDSSVEAGGPPLAVNVYDVDGPAAGALVGVVRFAAAEEHEWEEEERVVTVNSFACRERMAYRFELAGVGEVGFVNGFDEGLGVDGGLEIVYGC